MTPLIPMMIGLPLSGFWLWMLVDLANNDYLTKEKKSNWFLIFFLLSIFGAIWYYTGEYKPRHL